MWTWIFIILGVLVFIGIIRLMINKPDSFGEALFEVFCIDLLFDLLESIFENIDFD